MMSRATGKKIVAQDQKSRTSQETRAGAGVGEQEHEPGTPRTGKEAKEKRGWDKKIREMSREMSQSSREDDGALVAGIRISKQNVEEIRDVFMEFDMDGDGTITTKDKNGTIELDEFMVMMARRIRDSNTIREVFNVFDSNRDGVITTDELRKVMRGLGEDLNQEELDEMMRWADRDGDGVVGVSEFSSLMFETVRTYFSSQVVPVSKEEPSPEASA
ncbi:calmodulin-like protein 3 isoform X2 [Eurytemora carolleeae]|uniref:calmodulin-like protein 3 isoform X2 n=1 Tax=Eurytemora carolleeae TaxID=1294199 RepID=UPI000C760F13|nr:calmodulin-like protein 3 isoform X2 [Eurytemora carolleeae]|eukprot:XP_023323839.1 calmodulin-like protein 3 isoform X2 [Eurytemora affinis]